MTRLSALPPFGRSALKLFCAGGLILGVLSAFAQQGGGTRPAPPPPQTPATPPPKAPSPPPPATFPSATNPWDQNELIQRSYNKPVSSKIAKDDNCFLPPLNGLRPAPVRVADLQIPAKAQREHEDGCAALRNSKIIEAESHLRKAVKQWPKYLAAWVVLGQVLEAQQKTEEAQDACSQPLATDSNYLPAHLCLADISARAESWDKVLQLSTRAWKLTRLTMQWLTTITQPLTSICTDCPKQKEAHCGLRKSTKAMPTPACTSCWLKSMRRRVTVRVKQLN